MKKLLYPVVLALMSVNAIAQPNLVAHWEFTAGRTEESAHGWAAAVTGTGTMAPVAGRSGAGRTAMRFNGDSHIEINHDPAMDLTSWTISAVVRVVNEGDKCTPNYIIRRGNAGGSLHYGLYHSQGPTGRPDGCSGPFNAMNQYVFGASAAGTKLFLETKWHTGSVATQPIINTVTPEWKCITAMYNASTQIISLYVDNILYTQETWANQYSGLNSDMIFIGSSPNSTIDIDYVRLYDGVFPNPQDITACSNCTTTPIAHWTFDGTVNDVVNGWTPIHTPPALSYVPGSQGIYNTAMNFGGGPNDYLRIPSHPIMNLTSWTIAATVRPTAFWPSDCQENNILSRGVFTTSEYYSLAIGDNATDVSCGVYSPNGEVFLGAAAGTNTGGINASGWRAPLSPANPVIRRNRWYCAILSYDAMAEELVSWIDGNYAATYYMEDQYNYVTNPDLFIGAALGAGTYHNFTGDIDDIQLFDGVLCQDDVTQLAVCQNCLVPNPVPIMHWNFENNADELIHGWTPTVHNGPLTYSSNKVGNPTSALDLSAGTYLEFPSDPIMDMESWTITAVVKVKNFNNGFCQDNAIVSRGFDYDPDHYQLAFIDNAYEQSIGIYGSAACSTHTPTHEVFAAKAAGYGPAASAYIGSLPYPNPFIVADPLNADPNAWYCVAATYDGVAEIMSIYVNGVLVVSEPYANQYSYPSTKPLFIGAHDPLGGYSYFFDGLIDEVKIYDQALCGGFLQRCVVQSGVLTKPTQVNDVNKNHKVKIVPNPANDKVNIVVPSNWGTGDYVITNSIGAVVNKGAVNGDTEINVSTLPAGIYIISTQHEGVTNNYKVVVNH